MGVVLGLGVSTVPSPVSSRAPVLSKRALVPAAATLGVVAVLVFLHRRPVGQVAIHSGRRHVDHAGQVGDSGGESFQHLDRRSLGFKLQSGAGDHCADDHGVTGWKCDIDIAIETKDDYVLVADYADFDAVVQRVLLAEVVPLSRRAS